MTLVVDASVVVAGLVDGSEVGRWAEETMGASPLAAPALMPFEAANILRRVSLNGEVSVDVASLAHTDLLALTVELVAYADLAARAWELRSSVTVYDATYVALAEALRAPLATLDLKLARAPGPRCQFLTPPNTGS